MPEEGKKVPLTKMLPGPSSLFSILERGPAAVKTMRAMAGHQDPVPTRQEEEISPGELEAVRAQARTRSQSLGAAPSALRRGSIARHIPTGKKVTILRLDASSAEVVSKSGKKWISKLTDLK